MLINPKIKVNQKERFLINFVMIFIFLYFYESSFITFFNPNIKISISSCVL
ncbi:Hypothetical protein KK9_0083 [Borreliella garinii BgVir]|uniref:Uncharacterized protein n=1 Tax=Borrelia garinii subsp. bavariensis (strain ATCC BAA-2496 / DSM 23469 / PBi) TaxID=290434 RepID=A0A7I6GVI0_BORGP|nr:hypothetical protein BG0083 [Borreliella bavariensis PBi]AEW68424.1 Hypothetical protein KK9_0083 [Borreliella garinii BgVir]